MHKIKSKLPFMGGDIINLAKPVSTALPAISGTAQVGQTLTASEGMWTNSPASYAYQWQNEGSGISGATAATYTLTAGDLAGLITVAVTATNLAGSSVPTISPLAGPTFGATVYYVSQSAGSDSNNGTSPSAPWKTIAKVNAQNFAPGTSVLFKRGDVWRVNDFDGVQLAPKPSVLAGSPGNPIVFDAYGTGPNPVLQGSVAASNTSDWTNIGTNLWRSVRTFPPIVQPGNPSGLNGLPFNNANGVGNIIWNSGGTTFTGVETGLPRLAASPTAQGQWQFITAAGPGQWTVQVYSVGNPATAMPGLELAIDKSLILPFQIDYVIFQNFTLQYCAGSAFLSLSCNHLIIRDCIIQWIGGAALAGGDTRYGDGIDFEGSFTDNLAERNFVYQIYDGGITAQPGNINGHADNIIIRNNIIVNTTTPLFVQYSPGNGSNTINGMQIFNNSAYSPLGWSMSPVPQRPSGDQRWNLVLQKDVTVSVSNSFLENNILANSVASCTIIQHSYTEWRVGLTQDYNLWFVDPSDSLPVAYICVSSGTPPSKTVASWAPTMPVEQHGLIDVDPAFASPVTGNFVPTSTSPVRGAGVNLYNSGVVWDFYKKPRPATGPVTIGAIQ